ncbi:MAG TPA: hypothetical protein VLT17_12295, partial [Gemmatimonadales bacterium]|nr:hypothetical protein [Gemmatimonadales bacterium]
EAIVEVRAQYPGDLRHGQRVPGRLRRCRETNGHSGRLGRGMDRVTQVRVRLIWGKDREEPVKAPPHDVP